MVIIRQVAASEVDAALGPFDDLQPIGTPSGSGECWRAVRGPEVVAIKVIVRQHDPGRFGREVDALARITSTRVMRVVDSGTARFGTTEYPYLVSEFVEGQDVRQKIATGYPRDDELREFLLGCLDGLQLLAAADVVHRDIKPENLMLRNGSWDDPVIIDLGLSRLLDVTSMTVYPWAGGTWPYMAPEQLRGERAVPRSDVWAIAVVGGELARGSHPFHRGEASPPVDWDARLRTGITIPGSRPAGLAAFLAQAGAYLGYRRPDAGAAVELIERNWV